MKKILTYTLAVLSLSAMASCQKEQLAGTSDNSEAKLIVSASQDESSKVFLTAPKTLRWVADDKLIGFNTDGDKYVSEKRGGSGTAPSADFTFNTWSGVPAYFLFNFVAGKVANSAAAMEDGNILADVASSQTPVDSGTSICRWGPVTVGKAAKSETGYTASLKNVTGYIKLSFVNSKIQSLEISSVEGVDLAGKVKISTSSIDNDEPKAVVVKGAKSITFTPSNSAGHDEDGVICFNTFNTVDKPAYYYVSVLPGEFTPVLTFTDNQGRTVTKTAAGKISVARAEYYTLGNVDASVVFDESVKLPETLTFNLGKQWNFIEAAPVQGQYENQKAGERAAGKRYYGEVYNYNYFDSSTGFSGTYPFMFCKHYSTEDTDHGYYFDSSKGIVFIGPGACLSLPLIPNYALAKVEITCDKNSKLDNIFGFPQDENTLKIFTAEEADSYEFETLEYGKQYFLYFYKSSISDLKLTYKRASTVSAAVLGFDYPVEKGIYTYNNDYGNPFLNLAVTTDTAGDNPFYLDGYTFTPNTGSKFCWNSNFAFFSYISSNPMWIKLPKLPGYKLSKVKLGAVHAKNYAVSYGKGNVSAASDLTEVVAFSLDNTKTDGVVGVLNDTYDPEKDYYYVVKSNNAGVCKFLLTYRPL